MEKMSNGVVTLAVADQKGKMRNVTAVTPAVADRAAQADLPSWEELLGSNNWEGLLDPLDLSLRQFILRCGDFCQCTYDAFNGDKNSDYYGSSLYGKKSFFHKVKFEFADFYQVSSLLYATSTLDFFITWDKTTNFMGYIATSNDASSQLLGRREIYVVWRGTRTNYEWYDLVHHEPVSATELLRPGSGGHTVPHVMDGWLKIYTSSDDSSRFSKLSAREQLQTKIRQLIEVDYKNENINIVVTGHSLGASLAILSAFDLVENGIRDTISVTAIVFACPLVGDSNFTERLKQYPNLKILHMKNELDLVPKYPPETFGYRDAGIVLKMDSRKSPSLRLNSKDLLSDVHNLQGLLHVVSGWHGKDGKFEVVVKRSLALVNKSSDFLKDEYKIPASWWVVENKGMVLNDKGEWILAPPSDEDIPVPDF